MCVCMCVCVCVCMSMSWVEDYLVCKTKCLVSITNVVVNVFACEMCHQVLPKGRILVYPSVEAIPVFPLYHFKSPVLPNWLKKFPVFFFFFPFHRYSLLKRGVE